MSTSSEYYEEVKRLLMDMHDLSEDSAEQVLDMYEDDLGNHEQVGDSPRYVSDLLARRWNDEV